MGMCLGGAATAAGWTCGGKTKRGKTKQGKTKRGKTKRGKAKTRASHGLKLAKPAKHTTTNTTKWSKYHLYP